MRTSFTPDAQVVLRGRLLPLTLGIVAAFGLFFLRLFQLQIVESESLLLRSTRNAVRHVALAPPAAASSTARAGSLRRPAPPSGSS